MKRFPVLAVAATIALAGCGGAGSSTSQSPLSTSVRPTSGSSLTPFSMPRYTGAAAQNIESHTRSIQSSLGGLPNSAPRGGPALASSSRQKKDSLGGLPTFDLGIFLLDAPVFGPGAEVDLALVGVQAVANGTAYDIASYTSPVMVNLLDLQRSALALGTGSLPAMSYDSIRIIVDPSHSHVVQNGTSYPASFGTFDPSSFAFTPSSATVANVDFPVSINASTGNQSFLLDFNALESVVISNNVAQIGPAKVAAPESNAAVISGTVANNAGGPVSGAIVTANAADGHIAATTQTATDGTFQLHALVAGSYSVSVRNSYVTLAGATVMASGADSGAAPTLPASNIPAGYQLNVGTITD